jgi:nitrate/TMAO reductase-like tetraheme cytochrome c subunit
VTRKNERQERLAKEREDIAARIAKFKATQDRFMRERQEYAAAIWRRASSKDSMS